VRRRAGRDRLDRSPFDAAISSETTFDPATWILPLTSAGTVVAPPREG
jgi:hypothetical protein